MLKINIGGAKGFKKFSPTIRKEWKILDLSGAADFRYDLNSMKRMPIEDDSVDCYYGSHVMEHVAPVALPHLFKEIHRTLKPRGIIRIVVPDIVAGIKAYLNKEKWIFSSSAPTVDPDFPPTILGRLLSWFYTEGKSGHGHKMAFDWETLVYYVSQAGFREIKKLSYEVCSPIFVGKDFPRYKGWSLYLEARK